MSDVALRLRHVAHAEIPRTALDATWRSQSSPPKRGVSGARRLRHVARAGFLLVGATLLVVLGGLGFLPTWQCGLGAFACLPGSSSLPHRQGEAVAPRNFEGHFIYVYDLPRSFHRDIRDSRIGVKEHYKTEQVIHSFLERSNVYRTTQGDRAALFFIPLYAAQFLNSNCSSHSEACLEGLEKTAEFIEKALRIVQSRYSFWNNSGGKDHFIVLSHDNGRCSGLQYVSPSLFGGLFTLQLSGDQRLRSVAAKPPNVNSEEGYTKRRIQDIACFEAGVDIVIPPLTSTSIAGPDEGKRTVDLLGRFRVSKSPFSSLQGVSDGADVRHELLEIFHNRQPPGWNISDETEEPTPSDMMLAKVCACAPGKHSQWSVCHTQAVLKGCIPLTFFRYNAQPWEGELEYRAFSANIDPDHVRKTPQIVEKLVRNKEKLEAMQEALSHVQEFFVYNESLPDGALMQVVHELRKKAFILQYGEDSEVYF